MTLEASLSNSIKKEVAEVFNPLRPLSFKSQLLFYSNFILKLDYLLQCQSNFNLKLDYFLQCQSNFYPKIGLLVIVSVQFQSKIGLLLTVSVQFVVKNDAIAMLIQVDIGCKRIFMLLLREFLFKTR